MSNAPRVDTLRAVAERDEQHRADVALLACPVQYLSRVGVTADAITAAQQRVDHYAADLRAILSRPLVIGQQLAAFAVDLEQPALFDEPAR